MIAKFTVNGLDYLLSEIEEEEMDTILADREKAKLTAYPMYFDAKGRVWPRALDIKVEFLP